MRKHTIPALLGLALVGLMAFSSATVGQSGKSGFVAETGIAGIHSWKRVGRKTCIDGHWHYKTGIGETKKRARAAAIKQWEEFTAYDYGWAWMKYKLAVGKGMECLRVGAKQWSCDVQARACKLRRRVRKARKRKR